MRMALMACGMPEDGPPGQEAFVTAAESSHAYTRSVIGFDGAFSIHTAALSPEQIRSWFKETPLGGRLLQGWIDRAFTEGAKKSLLGVFRKNAVMGKGYPAMLKDALQAALDDGFKLTRREAITIARTYTQTANVEAQMAVYKANEDIIQGYRWCSILDTGVCARCAALDGMAWRKGEERPPIPLHPRCRCLMLPVLDAKELDMKPEELDRAARPWLRRELKNIDEGGRRKILAAGTTKEDFSGWWETLPEREQKYSMGPVRTRLLREGKIKFSELVDKSTGRLRTLEELGFTEGGKPLAAAGSGNFSKSTITIYSVADKQKLADALKIELSKHSKNGPIVDIQYLQAKYFMATNCQGRIFISETPHIILDAGNPGKTLTFTPDVDLKNAWNNIASAKSLTYTEECAMQAIWHETLHNRMVLPAKPIKTQTPIDILETVNEWVARRTYGDFMTSLGGTPQYVKEIIKSGPAYQDFITNFEALRNVLGIKDDTNTLAYFKNVIDTVDMGKYKKAISDFFAKTGNKMIKKRDINSLLDFIPFAPSVFLNEMAKVLKKP